MNRMNRTKHQNNDHQIERSKMKLRTISYMKSTTIKQVATDRNKEVNDIWCPQIYLNECMNFIRFSFVFRFGENQSKSWKSVEYQWKMPKNRFIKNLSASTTGKILLFTLSICRGRYWTKFRCLISYFYFLLLLISKKSEINCPYFQFPTLFTKIKSIRCNHRTKLIMRNIRS